MQPLFVARPGGPDVPLDRCGDCGALWFDFGELEAATGKPVAVELLDRDGTTRRCPACRLSMAAALLPGAVPVETCTACRGLFLDFQDVADLGSRRLAKAAKPPPAAKRYEGLDLPDETPPPPVATFRCERCGKRAPYSEANGTASGLVCRACTPQIQPMPAGPDIIGSAKRMNRYRMHDDLSPTFLDWLLTVFDVLN